MEELATYYVTLRPITKDGKPAIGARNIAYVSDPAIEEVGVYLSEADRKRVATEKEQEAILKYLESCGIEKPKHWVEVTEEEYLSAKELHLTTDPTSRESYNDFQKKDGGGQWLVRYKYSGPSDSKNRSFCAKILSLGRIYTEEEISNGLSNPEFGNYSIFDYKGSYGCRHVWKRQIYFEDYEDREVRKVGFVPQVISRLDDGDATTLNAYLSKDEKMQVVAPLLIPEKDVFRNDEIGRYNMRFSSDTIVELKQLAEENNLFEKKDLFKDTHEGDTAPAYVIDQWIIENENDKAYTDFGFKMSRVPIGTWMVASQVTDKNYWEKEIKRNKKHAYSIEALMNLTIIKMSKMENTNLVLPDGEHMIDDKVYVVKDGVLIEVKEVTEDQVEKVEEVMEEEAKKEGLSEEKPKEELEEEKPKEELEETKKEELEEEKPKEEMEETKSNAIEERLSAIEKQNEELLQIIAEKKAEEALETEEEKEVNLSDNRPLWKRVSDSVEAFRSKSNGYNNY